MNHSGTSNKGAPVASRLLRATAITMGLLVLGATGLAASGRQELKAHKTNLGAVHITFDPSYYYAGIQYSSWDRSYRAELDSIARENNVNFIHVEGGLDIGQSEYAVQALLDLGVDGIMTDRLGVLRDVYTARGVWAG